MGLWLTSGEIAALAQANQLLLAPFSFENGESWRRAACRAVESCVGADASSFAFPFAGEPLIAACPDVEHALEALLPLPSWIVDGLTVRRRRLGLTVTDWAELFDIEVVRQSAFYNDVVQPSRLLAPLVMLSPVPTSHVPAALSVYFAHERQSPQRVRRRQALLRLLFPAFQGGLQAYIRLRRHRDAMRSLAEDAATGILLFDCRGRLDRENDFFVRLMSSEPDRALVRAEVTRAARNVVALTSVQRSEAPAVHHVDGEIRTRSSCYRFGATLLESESASGGSVAVLVERVGQRRDGARDLAEHFSLTRREIEAAQLMRSGLSNREIATALGTSLNTARRHVERVLWKLDVHTRTAAAAKLSAW